MYEEQELTMQVFSEPEISTIDTDAIVSLILIFSSSISVLKLIFNHKCFDCLTLQQPAPSFGRRDSYEVSQMGDNTYATIQPRNPTHSMANGDSSGSRLRNSSSVSTIGNGEIADYATLRNISNPHPPTTVIPNRT